MYTVFFWWPLSIGWPIWDTTHKAKTYETTEPYTPLTRSPNGHYVVHPFTNLSDLFTGSLSPFLQTVCLAGDLAADAWNSLWSCRTQNWIDSCHDRLWSNSLLRYTDKWDWLGPEGQMIRWPLGSVSVSVTRESVDELQDSALGDLWCHLPDSRWMHL